MAREEAVALLPPIVFTIHNCRQPLFQKKFQGEPLTTADPLNLQVQTTTKFMARNLTHSVERPRREFFDRPFNFPASDP
jgi:hypothetical protein